MFFFFPPVLILAIYWNPVTTLKTHIWAHPQRTALSWHDIVLGMGSGWDLKSPQAMLI